MKTNKTLMKRLKITRQGKTLVRRGGQNHFNAKERRTKQLGQKSWAPFNLKTKILHRYLPSGQS